MNIILLKNNFRNIHEMKTQKIFYSNIEGASLFSDTNFIIVKIDQLSFKKFENIVICINAFVFKTCTPNISAI